MIQIDHVTFSYGEETEHTGGVRDIELQIKRGEFAVLCGESGCGKTTITRLINGLIPHYYEGKMSGGVWVNGAEVSKQPLYDTAKIVGSVFQNPKTQYFNANVTDELAFPAENIGLPAEDINRRITAVAERFGIGHLLHRSIFHLSGGQKQRIAVAAATMLGPRLVVLDEPTSNLDANAIADMRAMIEQMKGRRAHHRNSPNTDSHGSTAWPTGTWYSTAGISCRITRPMNSCPSPPAAWPPWDCGTLDLQPYRTPDCGAGFKPGRG